MGAQGQAREPGEGTDPRDADEARNSVERADPAAQPLRRRANLGDWSGAGAAEGEAAGELRLEDPNDIGGPGDRAVADADYAGGSGYLGDELERDESLGRGGGTLESRVAPQGIREFRPGENRPDREAPASRPAAPAREPQAASGAGAGALGGDVRGQGRDLGDKGRITGASAPRDLGSGALGQEDLVEGARREGSMGRGRPSRRLAQPLPGSKLRQRLIDLFAPVTFFPARKEDVLAGLPAHSDLRDDEGETIDLRQILEDSPDRMFPDMLALAGAIEEGIRKLALR